MKTIFMLCFMIILSAGSIMSQNPTPTGYAGNPKVAWVDNVHNTKNAEYVAEVKFNDSTLTSPHAIQLAFCKRYYQTLDPQTKAWYQNQLSKPVTAKASYLCGAKTKAGTPCRNKVKIKDSRCHLHKTQ